MLSRGGQIHQAALTEHVNPYNPVLQERLQGLAQAGATQNQHGLVAVYGMVVKQAMVLSYIDNFRLLAFLSFACIPAVFLFKRVKAKKGAVAMH